MEFFSRESQDVGYRRQTAGAKPTAATGSGFAKINEKIGVKHVPVAAGTTDAGARRRGSSIWTERRRYRTPELGGAWRKGDWNVARLLL
ncbi:hypothetical protein V6N11_042820 [Hibiscus sabdariffa]|uniref:Uncharacterized protein n=1 Tax=Hibiscus sabdariffa TaxID=183260 RepID=A0ABR2QXI9_9ROSI